MNFIFSPSTGGAPDWDLVQLHEENCEARDLSRLNGRPPPAEGNAPIRRWLHRVDDERLLQYFRLATAHDDAARDQRTTPSLAMRDNLTTVAPELLRLARELTAAHPADLYVRILLLDALLRAERLEELHAELVATRPTLVRSSDPLLRFRYDAFQRQIRARSLAAAGQNGRNDLDKLLNRWPPTQLTERLQLLTTLGTFREAITTVPSLLQPGLALMFSADMLAQQVTMKVARVQGDFLLISGRRDEARRLLVGMYRAARLFGKDLHSGYITMFVGIAMRAVMAGGLQTYAANGCLTAAEAQLLWGDLEGLNALETKEDLAYGQAEIAIASPPGATTSSTMETLVRYDVAAAKFQLIRLTLAARYHQMITGWLPTAPAQLAPLFRGALPPDPFTSPPASLRMVPAADSAGGLRLYSLGPDFVDNRGEFSYDPTNGTVSSGDVVVRLRVEREFPFVDGGLRATTWKDVLRAFPRGLPVDPFADTKARSYTLSSSLGPYNDGAKRGTGDKAAEPRYMLQADRTWLWGTPVPTPVVPGSVRPLYLFSVGPDTDQKRISEGGSWEMERTPVEGVIPVVAELPEVSYDPTNGTVSNGDLYIPIPPLIPAPAPTPRQTPVVRGPAAVRPL